MFGRKKNSNDCDHEYGDWIEASTSGVKALAALVGVDHSGKARYRICKHCGDTETD